jgi:hypothetical protein
MKEVVSGFNWYYKLLFLVKSSSSVDHVWFSFFEGMHCHAAIVAGLVCSKFNHTTNELSPRSLTLDDFKNEGAVKNFKVPGTTVEEHLDQIMAKEFPAPMFHNEFHLSVYIPKQAMDAKDLINATRLQSLWISNFKISSATTTISKVLARWLKLHCYTLQKTQDQIQNTIQLWPKVTICIIRKLVQSKITRKKFIHAKEKTNPLLDTLTALKVPFGMHTPKSHLASLQGRTS